MKALSAFIALALAFMTSAATAGAPVSVLGLPLGGQLKMPLRPCYEVKTDEVCWFAPQTTMSDLTFSGFLKVPGADKRPKWAADGIVEARLTQDGILRSFEVRTSFAKDYDEIVHSISSRFGQPQRVRSGRQTELAHWSHANIFIRLNCSPESGCLAQFVSGAAHEELQRKIQRQLAERKAKDAARSIAP